MNIILFDMWQDLINCWNLHFEDFPKVQTARESVENLLQKGDAIVSPANSFGFMNGGIDQRYTEIFGPQMQRDLQKKIASRPMKELLVGEAEFVRIEHRTCQWLVAAPTMRTPFNIQGTPNPYLAFKAALLCAESLGVKTLLCPGLGTGIGGVGANICAQQMAVAYQDWQNPKDYRFLNDPHTKVWR